MCCKLTINAHLRDLQVSQMNIRHPHGWARTELCRSLKPRPRTQHQPTFPQTASGTSTLLLGLALAFWTHSALALGNEGPAPTAVFAAAPANAWDAYDTVQSLRSKHSEVIHQGAPATETTLQNIRADLSAALTWLDTPIVRDMANGNTYLKFRRFDLLRIRPRCCPGWASPRLQSAISKP